MFHQKRFELRLGKPAFWQRKAGLPCRSAQPTRRLGQTLELTATLEPDTLVEARELEREMKRKKNRALIFHLSNPQRETIQIHFSICLFEAASYMVSGL